MNKYSVKIIGIKDYNIDNVKDFIRFEQNYLSNQKIKKIALLHYVLTAFNGNSDEIKKLEHNGWEIYTIESQDIGGKSDIHFNRSSVEHNIRVAL